MESEEALVERSFGEAAKLVATIQYASGDLKVWRNAMSLASRKICSFISKEFGLRIPNANEHTFLEVLRVVTGEERDLTTLCERISQMSPALRNVTKNPPPYLAALKGKWSPPDLQDGVFTGIVENLTSGRIERFRVSATASQVDDIGEGMRFDLI